MKSLTNRGSLPNALISLALVAFFMQASIAFTDEPAGDLSPTIEPEGRLIAGLATDAFAPIELARFQTASEPTEAEKLKPGESQLADDALTEEAGPEVPEGRKLEPEGVVAASETEAEELAPGESQLTDEGLTVGADVSLKPEWNNGLEFYSSNREFRVHVGGRAQFDTTAFTAGTGANLPPANGGLNPPLAGATNFRRGRFRIDGQMYENYEWITEFDLVNQLQISQLADPTLENADGPYPAPTEVWLAITQLPYVGNLVVGNQRLPGVMIESVYPNGPADRAGLLPLRRGNEFDVLLGDLVIAINEDDVTSVRDLLLLVSNYKVGDMIEVTIIRGGQTLVIEAQLAERPAED